VAIVTLNYYENTYIGEPVAAADFRRLEARAEDLIGAITGNQYTSVIASLTEKGYTAAAAAITTAYSKAICAQIEYYVSNGLLSVTTGDSNGGWTVGKVKVDGSDQSFAERGRAMVSPAALQYLEQTGLLSRSVGVPVLPFAPYPWEVF
jgi:hypothetical protein